MVLPLVIPALPADLTTVDASEHVRTTQQSSEAGDASGADARRHTVRAGETVSDVALRYDVSIAAIARRNHLPPTAMVYPGQRLVIPSGGSAVTRSAAQQPRAADARRTGPTRGYTVRSGDTLDGIARRHGMSSARLARLNGLSSADFIHPGQSIRVSGVAPKPGRRAVTRGSTPSPRSAARVVVRDGDTLDGIARRHGTSATRLARANGLPADGLIHPGQRLRVADGPARAAKGAAKGSAKPASARARSSATATTRRPARKSGGNTFAGRTYADHIVSSADRHRAILESRPVPSRTTTRDKIVAISRRHGVDPSLALAISYQESGWDQRKVSVADAVGTMQVIPSSGQWASQIAGRDLDLLDTDDNITAGVILLGQLEDMAASREHAIAGYYQGLGSVQEHGMYADTRSYVANVQALQRRM